MLRWLDRSALVAFGLGAVSVLAWAPFQFWPVLCVSLGLLYAMLDDHAGLRQAGVLGLFFGLGVFLFGVSWVYVSLSLFGGLPPLFAALSTFLFCLLLAGYPAVALATFVYLRTRGTTFSAWKNILLFAALLACADWLRGWFFTGFPWLALGYTQTTGGGVFAPLLGYAPLLGVYGVSVLVALCGAVLGEVVLARNFLGKAQVALPRKFCKWTAGALITLLLSAGYTLSHFSWTDKIGDPIKVALLQGNVEQDMKWNPARFEDTLRLYYELMEKNPAQLTVLPETALPTFYESLPGNYLQALKQLARREPSMSGAGGDVVIGSVVGSNAAYTNSVISLGAASAQRYDKSHLVPFGEYTPPGFAWFMRSLHIPMSGFTPGAPQQSPLSLSGQSVAFNICYEDVFGEEIAMAVPNASILINVSNTAWFGRSLAQPQHLQIAQMRALETGRPMLRATNTGMTAAIRPDGTVQAVLPAFTRGALVQEVQGMTGVTPYVRFGNGGALLLMLLFSLPALVSRWKSR